LRKTSETSFEYRPLGVEQARGKRFDPRALLILAVVGCKWPVMNAGESRSTLTHLLLLIRCAAKDGWPLATDNCFGGKVTNKRKTKITFETERLFVISKPTSRAPAWCDACGEHVRAVTAEDAALLANKSLAAISRAVESEKLHSTRTEEAPLLICLNSILSLK